MAIKGMFGPAQVAAGPTTVLIAPATEYYEVTVIWVSNPSASAINFTASIGVDGVTTRIIGTNATVGNCSANSVTPFFGSWRVPPVGIMTVSASTPATLVATITYNRVPV